MTATAVRTKPPSDGSRRLTRPLTRIEPRDGLVIDADAWATAHDYHRDLAGLHGIAAHGEGILTGLEVIPGGGRDVWVLTGVGLDADGVPLVLGAATRVSLATAGVQTGTVYVILQRLDSEPDDDGRVVETCAAIAESEPASGTQLELARINLGGHANVGLPKDPRLPGPDDIDTRFRPLAGGHARGEVRIADLFISNLGDTHDGVAGLMARAINRDGAYRARYVGEARVGGAAPDGGILYVSGNRDFALGEAAVSWLRGFLDSGGTLIGDGCHSTPADPFGTAFDRLAMATGRKLQRVTSGDRLLWAHYAFGAPPPGLVRTEIGLVMAADGIIYCAGDYGCILRGGGESPVPRETIRAVEEFAANIGAAAHERRVALDLS